MFDAHSIASPMDVYKSQDQARQRRARSGARRVGTGEEARRRVSRLVAAFDPCVSFDVRVQEAASA